MQTVLMIFGLWGLAGAIVLIVIGTLPSQALKYLSPVLVPVGLICLMMGFFWLWMIGAVRSLFWEPFSKINLPTGELKGIDQAMARALDYVSNPIETIKAL